MPLKALNRNPWPLRRIPEDASQSFTEPGWLAFLFFYMTMTMGFSVPAKATSSIPYQNAWVTNGTVMAIATDGKATYVGGDFAWVGPNTDTGIPVDPGTGSRVAIYPKVSGVVHAVVPDGVGGCFIGGAFKSVGELDRNSVAHILSNGIVDPHWDANTIGKSGGAVYALAVSGGIVYVGGAFSAMGGDNRTNIAALDAATGKATSWSPCVIGLNPKVYALAVSGGIVYVGGLFTGIGGEERSGIAALDATTGKATSWDPNASGKTYVGPCVYDLKLSDGLVYVGGDFTGIGGEARNNIAALDISTGSATSWNPDSNGSVYTLAVSGGLVYAGGSFDSIGAQTRRKAAALYATTGKASSWNPDADGFVAAITVSKGMVYVGGGFTRIGGDYRPSFARFDGDDPSTYSISGTAAESTGPLSEVTIALSAGKTRTTSTDTKGTYVFSDLYSGVYTITSSKVHYTFNPAQRTINVNGSDIAGLDFSAASNPGFLGVTLGPQEAVDAWARWRVDGGIWQECGSTISNVAVGQHTVTFKDIPGWITPKAQNITVESDKTSTAAASYVQRAVADFEASPTSGKAPLTVKFTDKSTGASTWVWEFGDGKTSTLQSPSHTYSKTASHTVRLTVTGPGGKCTKTLADYITITGPPPVAEFSVNPVMGNASLQVAFIDKTTGNVSEWSWNFGDGGTSSVKNPTYTYKRAGTYTVALTATGPGGSDTMTKTDLITVHVPAMADFSCAPKRGRAPLAVKFIDKSAGAAAWTWDFGDDQTSTERNPRHTYENPDTYTVRLTVSGPGGKSARICTNFITVTPPPPAADFSADSATGEINP